jgi:CspA family cold shock protein
VAGCSHFFRADGLVRQKALRRPKFHILWSAAMPNGSIKKVVSDRGFGFIKGERDELFFHHSALQGISIEQLNEGQMVQYEIGQGKKRPCAVSVRLVG